MALLCPECESPIVIDVDEVEEGDTVPCEDCGSDLEIVSLDPLKIALVDNSGYDDPEDLPFAGGEEEEDD
jgi:alpha-aminoadipate carrier protein LysW